MLYRLRIIALCLFLIAPSVLAQAQTTYFLDAINGNDSNDGRSPESAWKTIAKIDEYDNQQKFRPGDQILFRRGQVFTQTERIEFNTSGEENKVIIFSSYGDGTRPVLENISDWRYSSVFWIAGSYVSISDLTLRRAVEAGVDIRGDHVSVSNVEIYDTGVGISIQGAHATISENDIHDLKMIVNDSAPDNDYGAVAIIVGGSNAFITKNTLTNLKAPSIDYGFDGSAVEIYGEADSVEVYANYIEGCNDFLEVGSAQQVTVSNVRYNHNIIVGCHSAGVLHVFGGTSNWGVDLVNFQFNNNTLYGIATGFSLTRIPPAENVLIRNNIFALNDLAEWNTSTFEDTVHENNLYFSINNPTSQPTFQLHSSEILADPKLVSVGGRNYRLRAESPAVNTGAWVSTFADYDGYSIVDQPDMGAFEYRPTDSSPQLIANGGFEEELSNGWKLKGAVKQKCDKPAKSKYFAMTGSCAVEVRAGGKISQKLDVSGLTANEWVYVEGFVRYDTSGLFAIKVKFTDGTGGGGGSPLSVAKPTFNRVAFSQLLSATPKTIKLQIKHQGSTGKIFVDSITVREGELPSLMPLPK